MRSDGSSKTASPGLPAWTDPSALADAANGCGRADRSAWLRLLTATAESSAHRHRPRRRDQNPCSTSIRKTLQQESRKFGKYPYESVSDQTSAHLRIRTPEAQNVTIADQPAARRERAPASGAPGWHAAPGALPGAAGAQVASVKPLSGPARVLTTAASREGWLASGTGGSVRLLPGGEQFPSVCGGRPGSARGRPGPARRSGVSARGSRSSWRRSRSGRGCVRWSRRRPTAGAPGCRRGGPRRGRSCRWRRPAAGGIDKHCAESRAWGFYPDFYPNGEGSRGAVRSKG